MCRARHALLRCGLGCAPASEPPPGSMVCARARVDLLHSYRDRRVCRRADVLHAHVAASASDLRDSALTAARNARLDAETVGDEPTHPTVRTLFFASLDRVRAFFSGLRNRALSTRV